MSKSVKIGLLLAIYVVAALAFYRIAKPGFVYQRAYRQVVEGLPVGFSESPEYAEMSATIDDWMRQQPVLSLRQVGYEFYFFVSANDPSELSGSTQVLSDFLNETESEYIAKFIQTVSTVKASRDALFDLKSGSVTPEKKFLALLFDEKYRSYLKYEAAETKVTITPGQKIVTLNPMTHWHDLNPNFVISIILSLAIPAVALVVVMLLKAWRED